MNGDNTGGGLSAILGMLTENPELLKTAAAVFNSSASAGPDKADSDETEASEASADWTAPVGVGDIGALLSDPQLLTKLAPILGILGGAQSGNTGATDTAREQLPQLYKKPQGDPCTDLLCALKPYLSPARRETIDYILKINRLSGLFRSPDRK